MEFFLCLYFFVYAIYNNQNKSSSTQITKLQLAQQDSFSEY
jgi:cbb3-type cytochrome oxidase subunit 3